MEFGILTIADIGEIGLLQRLRPYCSHHLGDDAAVLDPIPSSPVVTTDVLIENVHFSERTTPAHAVGWRAATANLSDLAAMGSSPLALVIGLGLPPHTPVSWVESMYQGIRDCCQPWQVEVVGGDLCRSRERILSITALGQVQPHQAIWRGAAQPGDWLIVTGPHGDSRAGLELLLQTPVDPVDAIDPVHPVNLVNLQDPED